MPRKEDSVTIKNGKHVKIGKGLALQKMDELRGKKSPTNTDIMDMLFKIYDRLEG